MTAVPRVAAGPAPATTAARTAKRRALWSVLDQVLSSAASFVPFFLVAHTSTTAAVGAFGLAYLTYFLLLAIIRGLALEPLIVRHESGATEQFRPLALGARSRETPNSRFAGMSVQVHRRTAAAAAVGLALTTSTVIGLVLASVFLAVGGVLAEAFVPLGIFLPALLVNDSWRQVFFGSQRPRTAFVNDLCYVSLQLALFAAVGAAVGLSLPTIVILWGFAALGAAVIGGLQARTLPDVGGALEWLRRHRDMGPANAMGYAVHRGAEQTAMLSIGLVGGLDTVGAVVAARALFAPVNMIQSGLSAWALPEAARLTRQGARRRLRRFSYTWAAVFAILVLLGGLALAVVPSSIGEFILSATWQPSRQLLIPMTVFSIITAAGFTLAVSLRAAEKARHLVILRTATGLMSIAFGTIGVLTAGGQGAIWGMATASLVFVLGASTLIHRVQSVHGE